MSVFISAPTDLVVRLATDLGITLIAVARGKGMNVLSHTRGWGVET
jgi:formate dehydrogenase assembly factor FdhD